jgi:UDP-N-acetylmuramoylalanine--D-glutamate ligase
MIKKLQDLKNKRITIMGLGLNQGGLGVARFLAKVGAKILVTDLKTKEELGLSLEKLKSFDTGKKILSIQIW